MSQQHRMPNFSEEDNFRQASDQLAVLRPNQPFSLSSEASAFTKVFYKPTSELASPGPNLSALFHQPTNAQIAPGNNFTAGMGGGFADRNAESGPGPVGPANTAKGSPHGIAAQHVEDDLTHLYRYNFHNLISIQSQRQSVHGEVRPQAPLLHS
jgi:hypothetical protein